MARKESPEKNLKLSSFVENGKPTKVCWDYISNLSNVVTTRYFGKYLYHFDKDDLVSLATSDAVAFAVKVASSNTDDNIKSIRNVFFTRIRNTLSNFIFRSNKLVSTEDEILDKQTVFPKSFEISSDLIDTSELNIDSLDSFRTVSLRAWYLFRTNGARTKYFITDKNNNLEDWESYSEAKNMKSPCELISYYNNYTEDQIEQLASKLDEVSGQNYFSTLYQLLGDKFLAFLDVFQEDKFNIPSTLLVKHLLADMSICEDFDNGMSVEDISSKYHRSVSSVKKVLSYKEVI